MTSSQTYWSVENKVVDTDPGGSISNGCGVYAVPAWTAPDNSPPRLQRSFVPYEEKSYIYDPSKGRRFSKLSSGGQILMSEYTRGVDITQRFISTRKRDFMHASYTSTGICGTTGICAVYGPNPTGVRWTENDHIGSLSGLPRYGKDLDFYRSQVPDLVSSTQQNAFADALNAYDLLTELGELQETARYLLGKVEGVSGLMDKFREKDHDAYRKGRRSNAKTLLRSSDAALRRLGGRWMEYRYAIMPLIYSARDIASVLKERNFQYHSSRSKEVITCNDQPPEAFETKYLSIQCAGEITVKSLTKAAYDLGSLQRLANMVGFNPFRTAWELIPLSFVVGWAVNVGDAISSLTGIDYSSQRVGCTAVRSNVTETITHVHNVDDRVQWDWGPNQCGSAPTPWDARHKVDYSNIVQLTSVNSYVRTLWNRPEPKLVFNPYLNWKRFIDGLVLGYQPTKKLLRSLK